MAEPRDPWQTEVCRLFATLRALGGELSGANCSALFTGPPKPDAAAILRSLDVDVRIVSPVDPRCPHANKIRMLEQDDDVDWLVALDTDVLVTGDLTTELSRDAVRLRVVDADPLTAREWRRLYRHFGVKAPRRRLRTTCTGKRCPSYFNSGAVFVPRRHIHGLSAIWPEYVAKLLEAYDDLGSLAKHSFYTDQLALALTMASSEMPVEPLPIEVNTPTHAPIHPRWHPASIKPRLVHYHHRVDDSGLVLTSGYTGIDAQIEQANTAWQRQIGGVAR